MFFTAWIHLVFNGFKSWSCSSQTEEVNRFFFSVDAECKPSFVEKRCDLLPLKCWLKPQMVQYFLQLFKDTSFQIVCCSLMWVNVCFSSTWFVSHESSEGLTWRSWLSALKWLPSLVEETCSQSSVLHELHPPSELDAAQIKLSDGLFLVDPGRCLVVVFRCVQTKRIWRRHVAAHSGSKQIPLR